MTEVHTRDEAIILVDHACNGWSVTLTGVLTQAVTVADSARAHAESVVRRCASRVSALETRLRAARPEEARQLEAELRLARMSCDQARTASARIANVAVDVRRLARTHERDAVTRTAAARAQLAAMSRAIESYRAARLSGSIGGGASRTVTSAATGSGTGHRLTDVDVRDADLADTPIQGEFGRGGASRADYRWAVQTWNDTVGPGVANGMTRDDFAARDERTGAAPLRKTADVYDMFLGSDRIRVDRRPNGSLNIVNGRHRFQIARDLGINTLPGEVS